MMSLRTDKIVYDRIKQVSDSICVIDPNHVTLLNYGVTCIIGYLLWHKNRNLGVLCGLFVVRSILDILDGGIARKCNTTSRTGKILDILGDAFFGFMICVFIIVHLKKKYKAYVWIVYLFIVTSVYITYKSIQEDNYDSIKHNEILTFLYHNTILVSLFYLYVYLSVTS